jgi:hypothetical protein
MYCDSRNECIQKKIIYIHNIVCYNLRRERYMIQKVAQFLYKYVLNSKLYKYIIIIIIDIILSKCITFFFLKKKITWANIQ